MRIYNCNENNGRCPICGSSGGCSCSSGFDCCCSPRGATGPTGPTAPSIYAQHGNCRNHAAFHYLKDN